jgi:hypothetical protein
MVYATNKQKHRPLREFALSVIHHFILCFVYEPDHKCYVLLYMYRYYYSIREVIITPSELYVVL